MMKYVSKVNSLQNVFRYKHAASRSSNTGQSNWHNMTTVKSNYLIKSGRCVKKYQGCCLEPSELQEHAHVLESQQRLPPGNASVQHPDLSFHCLGYLPARDKCIHMSFIKIPKK